MSITVQGKGTAQWVSLYFANGDSTWRNTTVRCVPCSLCPSTFNAAVELIALLFLVCPA